MSRNSQLNIYTGCFGIIKIGYFLVFLDIGGGKWLFTSILVHLPVFNLVILSKRYQSEASKFNFPKHWPVIGLHEWSNKEGILARPTTSVINCFEFGSATILPKSAKKSATIFFIKSATIRI